MSEEFLKIAKDRLDDFFLYRETCNNDYTIRIITKSPYLSLIICQFSFNSNTDIYNYVSYYFRQYKVDGTIEDIDDIRFNNLNTMYITIESKQKIVKSLTITIDKIDYELLFYKINDTNILYFIKHNNNYYRFLHFFEFYMIFTCIAILHSKSKYSDIFDEIIGVKFNKRFDIYRPAVYHILNGYLSDNIIDTFYSFKIDNYLKYILKDKTIHFIDVINDYELNDNIFKVTDSIKYIKDKNSNTEIIHTNEILRFNTNDILIYNFKDDITLSLSFKLKESYIFSCNTKTFFKNHVFSVVILYYSRSKYKIFIVDSGFGMKSLENYREIKNNGLMYCRPFSCHEIAITETKTIFKLIFFIYFLNYLIKNNFLIDKNLYDKIMLVSKTDSTTNIIDGILKFDPKSNYYIVSYTKESYYIDILNKILENTYDASFLNTKYEPVKIKLDDINSLSTDLNDLINTDIEHKLQFHSIEVQPNGVSHDVLTDGTDISSNNFNMLIIPQQSGTCTWFCKYWSLVLIKLIRTKDQYTSFINNIYNICIRDLTRLLYTAFLDNQINFEINYMISIRILMSKLINLNIFKLKENHMQFYDLTDKSIDIVKLKLSKGIQTSVTSSITSSVTSSVTDDVTDIRSLIMLLMSKVYTKKDYLQIIIKIIQLKSTLEKNLVKINIEETFDDNPEYTNKFKKALQMYNNSLSIIDGLTENQMYLHNIKLYYILSYLEYNQNDIEIIKYFMKLSYYFHILIFLIITIYQYSTVNVIQFINETIGFIDIHTDSLSKIIEFQTFFILLRTQYYDDYIYYDNFMDKITNIKELYTIEINFINSLDHIISIESVNQQRDLLLDNPILVFNKSENKDSLEYYSVFFILNIHYINTKEDKRIELIRFFLSLYYKKKSTKTITISLIHLQILYYGSVSYLGIHMFDDDSTLKEICDITNTFFIKEPPMIITFLKLLLDNYLEKYKTVEEFIHEVNKTLFVTDKTESDTQMISIFKKHHKLDTVISDDMKIDKSYDYTFIKLLFGMSEDIYVIESSDHSFIYLLSLDYYIKIVFDGDKIKEIFYNGNRVLKPSEIELPFINILPVAGVYLIYEKNDKYYVVSFIHDNLQLTSEVNVLDLMRFKSRVLTIPISTVNRYYPATSEGWKNLDYVIEAYGYNQLNCFFVTDETKNGYVITENEMKYVKKTYLTFDFNEKIKEEADEFDIPFDFSEDILDIKQLRSHHKELLSITRSLFNIGQITKYEYNIMMNDNMEMLNGDIVETYGSCNKLSHKVNKLSLKTLPVKTDLTNYQSQINTQMQSLKMLKTFTDFKESILDYMPYIRYIKTETLLESLFSDSDTSEPDAIIEPGLETIKDNKMSLLASNMDLFKSRKHKYEYFFEYFFEFIFGIPTEEQFQIYKKITGNYDDAVKNKYQKMIKSTGTGTDTNTGRFKLVRMNMYGGNMVSINDAPITIQHFMMGKGKSSVLTPLLTMYFVLNHNKTVYIVVPEHLKKQTMKTMEPYIKIFGMDTVEIVTNVELYVSFLKGNIESQSIFLIDEIDSLVDPLKSNFNLIQTYKDRSIVTNLYNNIKLFSERTDDTDILDGDIMLYHDVQHYKQNLSNGILKYNINWGIHPIKAYAIPFINKDKSALESTFSSIVLTLFLTYYYYEKIAPKDNKLPSFLKTYIRYSKLNYKYGLNKINLTDEDLDTLLDKKTEIIKDVISTVQMTETQANISFVDLLLKDDVYKIGYSGTVNVKFPKVESVKYEIYEDKDEAVNIAYALSQAKIWTSSKSISEYDAYIDICGYFKDKTNEEQAREFRVEDKAIIFIDEDDNVKYIGTENKALLYSDNLTLDKPKIYFDQGHTVGIDIKQDKYPYMKALCYVSLNSKYSDVAQGLYRMRKLNAGQTVDLFLVDPIEKLPDISQLYNQFRKNQTDYVLASESLLQFQTVKALVRKKYDDKTLGHSEKVKYYFESNYNNILDKILEDDHTELLTKYGLNNEKLEELVYHRRSDSLQIQQQQQQQQQQTNAIYKTEYIFNDYKSNIKYSDFEVIREILDLSIAYKCSEHVYFLDDIFDKYENKNGFCFVKPDNTKNNLLLICAKHSIYFYDKPLYTLYLEPLNGCEQIFDKLKDKDMFIQVIFSMVDNISGQTNGFKAVLYTVLFILKSEDPLHLNYMGVTRDISQLPEIFSSIYNFNYRDLTDDDIKTKSHKIVDNDGKVIIYYIQGLKFKENTKYLYVVLGEELLLIDESVKTQFEGKKFEDINIQEAIYANNPFVTIIKNGYNYNSEDKKMIISDSYLNSLTYLVLMCMKVIVKYIYDQNYINIVYNQLLTYQKQFKNYYYNTDEIK